MSLRVLRGFFGRVTYEMAGQYTSGEVVTSTVLSGFALPVDNLFVAER